ncbi:MAG: PKD domain-containing protein [Muribaculaceae bacterium]|nr:PKD domain-containing protein [Muribaculaceae bacterium]
MKTKIATLLFGMAVVASSCSEEHTYYNTAAKTEIAQGADEYEVGEPITFTDNTTPSKGTSIKSYLWEFGDEDESTSTEQSPVFTYKKDGSYTVRLTVVDSNDLKSTSTRTVRIINPTKADFALDKEEYYLGDVVNFIDMSTTKGATTITEWKWEFADDARSTSDLRNPSFTYESAGSYPVTLTVTDSYGLTTSITKSVNIQDPTQVIATQWTAALGGAVKGGSSAAVSPDGSTVYMLRSLADSDLAALFAYDAADGQVKWTFDLSAAMSGTSATAQAKDVFSSPSVGADGTIYMVVRDLQSTTAERGVYVIAANPDGTLKWAKKGGASGTNLYAITPAVDAAGNIFVATRGNEVWKFSRSGDMTAFATDGVGVTAGMSVSKSGTVYGAANGANGFFALDGNSGAPLWKYNTDFGAAADALTGALRSAQAAIDTDGTVYYVTDAGAGGQIIAFSAAGSVKWIHATAGAIPDGGVVIAEDGTLYSNGGTASSEGLIALNGDGSLKWTFATRGIVQTSPVLDNRGYIHVVDAMANYYVVKPDGTLLAEAVLGQSCTSAPVMDAAGRLYVTVLKDGIPTVVCVTSKATSYNTAAPWAMRGQNPCRTGLQK